MRIIRWNGKDLPEELRDLPSGTYAVEPSDAPMVTDEEEAALSTALASLQAGHGRTVDQVQQTVDAIVR